MLNRLLPYTQSCSTNTSSMSSPISDFLSSSRIKRTYSLALWCRRDTSHPVSESASLDVGFQLVCRISSSSTGHTSGRNTGTSGYPTQFKRASSLNLRCSSFCERMQNKHPNAHLWRSGAIPPVEIQTSEDRYLLITPVLPEPDRSLPIFTNPDVPGREFVFCGKGGIFFRALK